MPLSVWVVYLLFGFLFNCFCFLCWWWCWFWFFLNILDQRLYFLSYLTIKGQNMTALSLFNVITVKIPNYFLSSDLWRFRKVEYSGLRIWYLLWIDILCQFIIFIFFFFFRLRKHSTFSQALESFWNPTFKVLAIFLLFFLLKFPLCLIYITL